MGEEEEPDPWNGQGVRLKAFEDDERATTVNHVKAKLDSQVQQEEEADKCSEPSPQKLSPGADSTDNFCTQLRHALDRVRALEQQQDGGSQQEAAVVDEGDNTAEPLEPRRRRRTRAPRHRSASPATSSSSSGSSADGGDRAVRRTQHELSHARAERLQRQRQRPSKVDGALAKRQRSLNRVTRPARDLGVSAQTLESHVRQRAYSLDAQDGWASLPIHRRSSNGEFVVKRFNAFLEDETELQAPAVNWETLRMAREKCTEWLVKHVLLPDPVPRTRNAKSRIA